VAAEAVCSPVVQVRKKGRYWRGAGRSGADSFGRTRQTRMRPTIIAIGGFNSDSGKTTLVCELLRMLPGWEALKMTRGHYRSCGRDPHACCVSHLLGEEPSVRSGRAETYAQGKDTGRYWDAGASEVHWAVVTDRQVEQGFRAALSRVKAPGVIVEGNSFLNFSDADFTALVARADVLKIKPTARRVLPKASALYLSDVGRGIDPDCRARFDRWWREAGLAEVVTALPVYTREELPRLFERIVSAHERAQSVPRRSEGHVAARVS
jgi:molybdopterin-guanine dinucleotide biosynthesis protein